MKFEFCLENFFMIRLCVSTRLQFLQEGLQHSNDANSRNYYESEIEKANSFQSLLDGMLENYRKELKK